MPIFLYDYGEASVKFVDFANQNLARMVIKIPWNFAGGKYNIPITACKIFST